MSEGKNNGRPSPPAERRWKKGISGNPRGRLKKQDNLTSLLRAEIAKRALKKSDESVEASGRSAPLFRRGFWEPRLDTRIGASVGWALIDTYGY